MLPIVERSALEIFNATCPEESILILVHLGDLFQVTNQVSHAIIPFTIATPHQAATAQCISYSSMLEASIPTDGHSAAHYELEKQIARRKNGPIKRGQSMTFVFTLCPQRPLTSAT